MKLILENWQKYIDEGMVDDQHNFKYYAFDWDDNLVEMPTKIVLLDKSGKEVFMGTEDFADYRGMIGKEEFDYEGSVVKDYAQNPFRNFRVAGDAQFLKDVEEIKSRQLAPSWDDFVECLNTASIFAIITARGHDPETLKEAVRYLINKNIHGIDSELVSENMKKYRKLFGRKTIDDKRQLIEKYLGL